MHCDHYGHIGNSYFHISWSSQQKENNAEIIANVTKEERFYNSEINLKIGLNYFNTLLDYYETQNLLYVTEACTAKEVFEEVKKVI